MSSERLSEQEIEELARLEKAATPGPWKSIASQIEKGFRCVQFSAKRDELYNTSALLPADAALIAAARNALPRLLAERDAMVKEIDEAVEVKVILARQAEEAEALADKLGRQWKEADDAYHVVSQSYLALRRDFERYADHDKACEYALGIGGQFNRCTCGLTAARTRWATPIQEDRLAEDGPARGPSRAKEGK